MRELPQVTLIGVDCVDAGRLAYAASVCTREIRFGAVRLLTSLPHEDPNVVAVEPVTSIEGYSSFMVKRLDAYVETPFALVIQYDGFILNPDAWLDEYLEYDYIGAPWYAGERGQRAVYAVGNGGFSLRSKRLLTLLREDDSIRVPADTPEDLYICVKLRPYLESRGIRFAPYGLAREFSFEGNRHDGVTWARQFGFHSLKCTDISRWLREHPGEPVDNALSAGALALKARLGT